MTSDEIRFLVNRPTSDHARLIACCKGCAGAVLTALAADGEPDAYLNQEPLRARSQCAWCAWCGRLVARPDECRLHGSACPLVCGWATFYGRAAHSELLVRLVRSHLGLSLTPRAMELFTEVADRLALEGTLSRAALVAEMWALRESWVQADPMQGSWGRCG